MGQQIGNRLVELGIEVPESAVPRANYVPVVISGNLAFVAGQIPLVGGELKYSGSLANANDVARGQAAARVCALNILGQLKLALDGDLDRIVRFVKLGGFVWCEPGFTDQHKVINGASDLIGEIFADAGLHARFAVGAPGLPLGASVEIDAVVEIR